MSIKKKAASAKTAKGKAYSKSKWKRPLFEVPSSTEFPGYAVLTVVPGIQSDLGPAVALAQEMKRKDRIYDWRPAIPPRGISVILKPGTKPAERLAIADAFIDLGYQVIERPG